MGPVDPPSPPLGTFADIYFWKLQALSFPKLVVCTLSVAGCGRGDRLKKGTDHTQNYAKVGGWGNVN